MADTGEFKLQTKSLSAVGPKIKGKLAPFQPLASSHRPPRLDNVCYTSNVDAESCFSASLNWPSESRAGKFSTDRFETYYLGPKTVASLAQIQGNRDHNEDRALLKKLPSRTGRHWLKKLQKAFLTLGKEMNTQFQEGTTLVASILSPDGKVVTGYIGDSEGHLGIVDRKDTSSAIGRITNRHNVFNNEADIATIKSRGGIFSTQTGMLKWTEVLESEKIFDPETGLTFRKKRPVCSNRLALTRALGDKYFSHLIRDAEFQVMDFRKRPLKKHQRAYIILNSDGCKNPHPEESNGYWNNLMFHADAQNQSITSAKKHSESANLAAWLLATSESLSPGDNSTSIVIPVTVPHLPVPYSILGVIADGHGGHKASEYAIKRLPELLA